MADSGGYFLRLGRFCQAYGALAPPLDILLVGPERHHEGILNFMPMGKGCSIFQRFRLGLVEVEVEAGDDLGLFALPIIPHRGVDRENPTQDRLIAFQSD